MPIARMLLAAANREIAFVGEVHSSSGTALTLTGLGLQAGDFVLAMAVAHTSAETSRPSSPPSGWTEIIDTTLDTYVNTYAVYQIVGASPPSSVTLRVDSDIGAMMAVAFRGVRSSSPVLTSTVSAGTINPASRSTGGWTPAASVCCVFVAGTAGGMTVPASAPSGWTLAGSINAIAEIDNRAGIVHAYRLNVTDTVDPGTFSSCNAMGAAAFHLLLGGG